MILQENVSGGQYSDENLQKTMFEPPVMMPEPNPQNVSYSQFEVEMVQTKRTEVLIHDAEVYTEGMHMTGDAKLTKKTSLVNTPHKKTK